MLECGLNTSYGAFRHMQGSQPGCIRYGELSSRVADQFSGAWVRTHAMPSLHTRVTLGIPLVGVLRYRSREAFAVS